VGSDSVLGSLRKDLWTALVGGNLPAPEIICKNLWAYAFEGRVQKLHISYSKAQGLTKGKNHPPGLTPGAHACNPSYLGGRDQEDHDGSKPAHTNNLRYPISKKPVIKKGW
jgi:hypothetical protein